MLSGVRFLGCWNRLVQCLWGDNCKRQVGSEAGREISVFRMPMKVPCVAMSFTTVIFIFP